MDNSLGFTRRKALIGMGLSPFFGGATIAPPDKNTLLEYLPAGATDLLNYGNYDLTGRTPRDGRLDPTKKNLVMAVIGQSNTCDVGNSTHTPANPTKLDNLCIYNGGCYPAVEPLLGCSRSTLGPGNAFLLAADTFVTNAIADRVVVVPAGIGATTIAMWAADAYNRIAVLGNRLSASGYLSGVATVIVCLQIGETDCGLGTSQVAYAASQTQVIANIRLWHSGPIFIAKSTYQSGGTTSAAIQAAQVGAVTGGANGIWSLGNMDQFAGANRQADGTHLTGATGQVNWAAEMYTNIHAYGAPL